MKTFPEPLFAPALEPGDTLALIAPAGALDRTRIERAIGRLEKRGFHIKCYRDIYQRHGYFAGKDEVRAAEINEAFADPEVAAVIPARGGNGVTRLLDQIDYAQIKRNPKIATGFSDITALHAAIQSQTGLVTFHSPNPMDGLGRPKGMSEVSADSYWRALLEESYGESEGYIVPLSDKHRNTMSALAPGKASGRLVGGNLALLCSVVGTPYEFNMKGSILLLEDIDERPYRIDRFLSQLKLAGHLRQLSGIVLGQFTDCEPTEGKPSLTLDQIFAEHLGDLGIPILQNFPTGHAVDNVTLPLGALMELDVDQRQLTILENPVSL